MKKSVFLTGTDQDLEHKEYIDLWCVATSQFSAHMYLSVSLPSYWKGSDFDRLANYDILINISPRADLDLGANRMLREEIKWAEEHGLVIIDYAHSEDGASSIDDMMLDLVKAIGLKGGGGV